MGNVFTDTFTFEVKVYKVMFGIRVRYSVIGISFGVFFTQLLLDKWGRLITGVFAIKLSFPLAFF